MKKGINFLIFICVPIIIFGQCQGRYQNEIFDSVSVTTVEYSDVHNWSESSSGLDMDIYYPNGDTVFKRPLIIFAHGGSFYQGDKDNPEMFALCESFAKKGYVTASIQYRLTTVSSLADSNAMIQTVFNAISDMKAAIRYFRKDVSINNNTFGIDTSQIFIGGYSAGAILSVNLAFLNNESEVPVFLQQTIENAGGIEGNSGNEGYSSKVKAVVSLAGAVYLKSFIDADDVPIVSVHAKDDGTVTYECNHALGISLLPILCGSGQVHEKAESVGIINDLYSFESGGHVIPLTELYNVSIPFVTDFLYHLLDCNSTAISEQETDSWTVFPNPSNGVISVRSNETILEVNVFDFLGRKVMSSTATSQINLENLSKGVHFIQLISDSKAVTKKLILR